MKKLIVCFIGFACQALFGLHDTLQQTSASLTVFLHHHEKALKAFCISAIESFGATGIISSQHVMHWLQHNDHHQKEIPWLTHLEHHAWIAWMEQQTKALIVIVEHDSIPSAVCLAYVQHCLQQKIKIPVYQMSYEQAEKVRLVGLELNQQHQIIEPFEVVPNLLWIHNGQLWQIPDDSAIAELKNWIDLLLS